MGLLIAMLLQQRFPPGAANRLADRAADMFLEIFFNFRQQVPPILHAKAGCPMNFADELATELTIAHTNESARLVFGFIPCDADLNAAANNEIDQLINSLITTIGNAGNEWQPEFGGST